MAPAISVETTSPPGSRRKHVAAAVAAFALIAGAVAIGQNLLVNGLRVIFTQPDAEWYVKIANGDISATWLPWAWRQLAPLISRATVFAFHVDVRTAFLWQGVASLIILLALVGVLLFRRVPKVFFFAAIAGLALWASLFLNLMLPDLLNAALLACLLLLLDRRHYLAASLMLFPLFLSRESTALALVCLLAAGWREFKRRDLAVAVIASVAGRLTVSALASAASTNREQVSPLLYLVGKIPWNLALNLGFPLWNTRQQEYCAVPHGLIPIHLGGIAQIGFCGFQPQFLFSTLRFALGLFGLLPLLFIYLWKKRALPRVKEESPLMRFCLFYGIASFLIAPLIGHALLRLFAYAWPLFVVYVPSVMRRISLRPAPAIIFLVLHFAVTWSNESILPLGSLALELSLFCLYTCAYLCAWILLTKQQESSLLQPA
jgi:hypothetical protein